MKSDHSTDTVDGAASPAPITVTTSIGVWMATEKQSFTLLVSGSVRYRTQDIDCEAALMGGWVHQRSAAAGCAESGRRRLVVGVVDLRRIGFARVTTCSGEGSTDDSRRIASRSVEGWRRRAGGTVSVAGVRAGSGVPRPWG